VHRRDPFDGSARLRARAWPLAAGLVSLLFARTSGAEEAAGPAIDLSPYLPEWAKHELLGVSVWQFAAAFVSVLAGLVLKVVSDHLFGKRWAKPAEGEEPRFNHIVATAVMRPLGWLFFLGGLAGAVQVLPLPDDPGVSVIVEGALWVLLVADFIWFLFRIVDLVVAYLAKLASRTESTLDDQLVPLLSRALKVTLVIVCFVWVVQLMGYSVSSLIAGLGIGGLAVALALQDTLGNFFGSVFIFLDKPFSPGDWVKIGDVEGIVEEIGFRTTKLRTWPESLISVPNKTVASSVIDNCSKMPRRRVYQNIAVTYDATPDQMEKAVAAIRELLLSDDDVDTDHYYLIRLSDFTESGLSIMLYYFTRSLGWNDHMATRERMNLGVMRALDTLGLKLAVPSRQVILKTEDAKAGGQKAPSAKENSQHESSRKRSTRK